MQPTPVRISGRMANGYTEQKNKMMNEKDKRMGHLQGIAWKKKIRLLSLVLRSPSDPTLQGPSGGSQGRGRGSLLVSPELQVSRRYHLLCIFTPHTTSSNLNLLPCPESIYCLFHPRKQFHHSFLSHPNQKPRNIVFGPLISPPHSLSDNLSTFWLNWLRVLFWIQSTGLGCCCVANLLTICTLKGETPLLMHQGHTWPVCLLDPQEPQYIPTCHCWIGPQYVPEIYPGL